MMKCILFRDLIKVLRIVTVAYKITIIKTKKNQMIDYSNLMNLRASKIIIYTMILSLLIAIKYHNFRLDKTEVLRMKAKVSQGMVLTDRASAALARKNNQSHRTIKSQMDKLVDLAGLAETQAKVS